MKKSNKGFTLIELLGVVVILAIVISLVFTNVINIIKKSSSDIDSNTEKLIYNAINLTLRENQEIFPNDEVTTYCLTIKDLVDYGYLIDNVNLNSEDIKSTKAVLATPTDNGYEYEIVDKEECTNIEIVPSINKCLKDKKCHICNKLSDLIDWGYIKDDVVLDGIDITNTSYDFGDKSLGIKAGYVSNEECNESKIKITYKGLPEFSKAKAKSLGITYTSTSDYYSLSTSNEFTEQIRKNSALRRNFSKDDFSTFIMNVEYKLNNKVLNIDKNKLTENTNIIGAYNVCVNGECTSVEKGTTNYEVNNLPAHTDLLVNNLYVGTGHTGSTYQISVIDKDYNIYTKTMYSISLNGNLYTINAASNGKYESGTNITVTLPGLSTFNTLIVNSNPIYDYTSENYSIQNIDKDYILTTAIYYNVCVNNVCKKVEKGTINYEVDNLPAHTDLLVNNLYVGTGHTESTYQISVVDKDYNIYTKTMYSILLNGNLYNYGSASNGKYEKGSNAVVDLSSEEEFNTVIVNGNHAEYNSTNLTYTISNISSDINIITKMFYTIKFNNFYVTGTTSTATVEKGKSYTVYLDSSIPKAEIPFNEVVLTNQKTNTNLVSGTDYTYTKSSGKLIIPNITSDILVKAYYKVTYVDNTFMGSMGWTDNWKNSNNLVEVNLIQNNVYFEKYLGSYRPDVLELKIGTATSDNYTYNNGIFKISKSKIVNNMTITASDDDIWVEPPELYNGALTPIIYMQIKYSDSAMTNEVSRVPVLNNIPAEESDYYYRYEWVVADPTKMYYNYKKQIWANAVVLKSGVTKNVGDIVEVDPRRNSTTFNYDSTDATAMFVWIPRFSYTIGCKSSNLSNCYGNYNYASQINGPINVSASTPGLIDVKFISKSSKDKGSAKYYGTDSNYYTMPAFTLTESDSSKSELAGIWVAKFGMSHKDKTSTGSGSEKGISCTLNNTCNSYSMNLFVLPNSRLLRNTALQSFYNLVKTNGSFQFDSSKADMHLLKNSEWAAAAYLAMSLYGKYGNINYNLKYVAGHNRGNNTTNCSYCSGYSTNQNKKDSSLQLYYYNQYFEGTSSSTTGNIYGIYDMGYGTAEMVMGYVGTKKYDIASKYIDIYTYNIYPKGNGLIEIENFYNADSDIFDDSRIIIRSNTPFPGYYDTTDSSSGHYKSRPSIFAKTGS